MLRYAYVGLQVKQIREKLNDLGAEYIYTLEGGWLPPSFGTGAAHVTPGIARRLHERDKLVLISHGRHLKYRAYTAPRLFSGLARAMLAPSDGLSARGSSSFRTSHYYTHDYVIIVYQRASGKWAELVRDVPFK